MLIINLKENLDKLSKLDAGRGWDEVKMAEKKAKLEVPKIKQDVDALILNIIKTGRTRGNWNEVKNNIEGTRKIVEEDFAKTSWRYLDVKNKEGKIVIDVKSPDEVKRIFNYSVFLRLIRWEWRDDLIAAISKIGDAVVMYYNKEKINKMSPEEVKFILLHEALHIDLGHFEDFEIFKKIPNKIQNIIMDAEINTYLGAMSDDMQYAQSFLGGGLKPIEGVFFVETDYISSFVNRTKPSYNVPKTTKKEETTEYDKETIYSVANMMVKRSYEYVKNAERNLSEDKNLAVDTRDKFMKIVEMRRGRTGGDEEDYVGAGIGAVTLHKMLQLLKRKFTIVSNYTPNEIATEVLQKYVKGGETISYLKTTINNTETYFFNVMIVDIRDKQDQTFNILKTSFNIEPLFGAVMIQKQNTEILGIQDLIIDPEKLLIAKLARAIKESQRIIEKFKLSIGEQVDEFKNLTSFLNPEVVGAALGNNTLNNLEKERLLKLYLNRIAYDKIISTLKGQTIQTLDGSFTYTIPQDYKEPSATGLVGVKMMFIKSEKGNEDTSVDGKEGEGAGGGTSENKGEGAGGGEEKKDDRQGGGSSGMQEGGGDNTQGDKSGGGSGRDGKQGDSETKQGKSEGSSKEGKKAGAGGGVDELGMPEWYESGPIEGSVLPSVKKEDQDKIVDELVKEEAGVAGKEESGKGGRGTSGLSEYTLKQINILSVFEDEISNLYNEITATMKNLISSGVVAPLEFAGKFVREISNIITSYEYDPSGALGAINVIDEETGEIKSYREVRGSNRVSMFMNVVVDISGSMSDVIEELMATIVGFLRDALETSTRFKFVPILNFVQIDVEPVYWATVSPDEITEEDFKFTLGKGGGTTIQPAIDLLYTKDDSEDATERWREAKERFVKIIKDDELRESFERSAEIYEKILEHEEEAVRNLIKYAPLIIITDQATDPLDFRAIPPEVPIVLVTNMRVDGEEGVKVFRAGGIKELQEEEIVNDSYIDHDERELWAVVGVDIEKLKIQLEKRKEER